MLEKNSEKKFDLQKGIIDLAIILILVFASAFFVGFRIFKKSGLPITRNIIGNISRNEISPTITPTPFPFQEMTIPGLRNRSYESTLSDLEKVSDHESYTSYTTSYSSDGLKIYGYLTIPKGDVPDGGWPGLIFVHGYIPPQNYKTLSNYVSYVDPIAKNGFVVFKIDLRGHDKSEGDPAGAYYSAGYIIDTLNAYSALQNADFVNPNRVGLWGHSMAGNIVFRSFVATENVPAAVIWAGAGYTYLDLQQFRISDNSYRPPPPNSQREKERQRLRDLYGNFDPNSWFWKEVVPTNYLEGVSGALLINHAVDDNVVSIDYSRNLMKILDSTGISHKLIEYPSGGHNITGAPFTKAMDNTVEFYKENL